MYSEDLLSIISTSVTHCTGVWLGSAEQEGQVAAVGDAGVIHPATVPTSAQPAIHSVHNNPCSVPNIAQPAIHTRLHNNPSSVLTTAQPAISRI